MSEQMGPINPIGGGSDTPNGQGGPVNPDPLFKEETNYARIYQIALGAVGFILLISLIFVLIYYKKANRTGAYIDGVTQQAKDKKEQEVRAACDLEKKDIRENPWTNFTARDDFGAFKFVVPRNWAEYEYFDMNANNPYSIYFSPDIVRYDSGLRKNHAALEVVVSKKLYAAEIKDIKETIKSSKDGNATEETVNISNFSGSKFVYKDKDLGRKIGVVLLPYRDRALFIKTDDYDKWNEKYYDKFYKSFALTP